VALLFLLAPTDDAAACSCMKSGPPCEAAWKADAVFSGVVRSIEPVEKIANGQSGLGWVIRFEVERGFINAQPGPLDLMNLSRPVLINSSRVSATSCTHRSRRPALA
jgi:hypothetical protein